MLKPLYPLAIYIRNKFFVGKLSTYLYKELEKELTWLPQVTYQSSKKKRFFDFFKKNSNSGRAATLAEYASPHEDLGTCER